MANTVHALKTLSSSVVFLGIGAPEVGLYRAFGKHDRVNLLDARTRKTAIPLPKCSSPNRRRCKPSMTRWHWPNETREAWVNAVRGVRDGELSETRPPSPTDAGRRTGATAWQKPVLLTGGTRRASRPLRRDGRVRCAVPRLDWGIG